MKTPHQQMMAAAKRERDSFNSYCSGLEREELPILETAFGRYFVAHVDNDFWYECYAVESPFGYSRRFAGCNNHKWQDLLRQCSLKPDPYWKQHEDFYAGR